MNGDIQAALSALVARCPQRATLDDLALALANRPVDVLEIEALLDGYEREGRVVEASSSADLPGDLRRVLQGARALRIAGSGKPNVSSVAEAAGMSLGAVVRALLFSRTLR